MTLSFPPPEADHCGDRMRREGRGAHSAPHQLLAGDLQHDALVSEPPPVRHAAIIALMHPPPIPTIRELLSRTLPVFWPSCIFGKCLPELPSHRQRDRRSGPLPVCPSYLAARPLSPLIQTMPFCWSVPPSILPALPQVPPAAVAGRAGDVGGQPFRTGPAAGSPHDGALLPRHPVGLLG